MKRLIPTIIILSIFISGCSLGVGSATADATATISPEDIRSTADAMVYDMLTQTQAAIPTNTFAPPTNTPIPPATATITLVPTFAIGGTPTSSLSAIAPSPTTAAALPTSTKATTGYSCMDKQFTNWTGESVQLSVTNNVKKSTANVFLCITTEFDGVGFISIPLEKSNSVQVPYGAYSATAWVNGKKSFNATTTFVIKSPGNVQIVIEQDKIFFRAGCAPNC